MLQSLGIVEFIQNGQRRGASDRISGISAPHAADPLAGLTPRDLGAEFAFSLCLAVFRVTDPDLYGTLEQSSVPAGPELQLLWSKATASDSMCAHFPTEETVLNVLDGEGVSLLEQGGAGMHRGGTTIVNVRSWGSRPVIISAD